METTNKIVSIYTEATPNPATMKFVVNQMLLPQNSVDFPKPEAAKDISPLAEALFTAFDYVSGVFIMNNFVTITKAGEESDWFEIAPQLREFIRNYVSEGKQVVNTDALKAMVAANPDANPNEVSANDSEIVAKIKELLTKYVQPAVEMDGGAIVFRSFNNGVLTLGMQGSCSGCPSSTITLKAGIEGLLKRMVPSVESVEAEML
ncbi:MAG TPA: NifU family protein [Chitinophagales bacterium]|nr:NifU family protein [Chitinophagales bacterium]HRK27549.1 NifU family protein [Chitinophagales bacterium]